MTVRLLIIDAADTKTTRIDTMFDHDIVLAKHPTGSDWYEVLKNRWGAPGGQVGRSVVDKFLDECGVRSAT